MLEKAINIASQAHDGQLDKAGKPYILHPLRVMNMGTNDIEMICGILHDVVEDTPVSLDMLKKEGFSDEILEVLSLLTHKKEHSYQEYIEIISTNKIATQIKLYDLSDNMNRARISFSTTHDDARQEKYQKAYDYLLNILK